MSVVGSKGKAAAIPTTPTSSQKSKPENEDMPDAPEVTELRETLRVKLPDTYSGNRKDLEVFLLQVELYTHFNDDKFPTDESYGLWTSSYLRGEALRWIEPFLKDYFQHDATCGTMVTTQTMFGTWKGFKKEIRRMFGDIDEIKTAEDHLYGLKQTGSALTYATEFQRYGNQTNWDTSALISHYRRGLKSHVRMELARMEHQPTDMVSLIEHTVRIDNRLYEFQKERRTYANPKTNYKYRGNEGRKRDNHPRDNRWNDPMELDATFKTERPRDPKKDRQFKERLCFNCDKPGHMARDCRQPKKGNGGRKFGKQLNATFQGRGGYNALGRQLNATFTNKPDWGINGDSTPEDASSSEESSDSSDSEEEELTPAERKRLAEFEEDASQLVFKDQLPGTVDVYRRSILRMRNKAVPVPGPPARWPGTMQDWEVEVRTVRCRPGYPHQLEPRGSQHTELEATNWLKYKIAEYYAQDAQNAQDVQQAEDRGPEPWELRADKAAMDYEPTDKDVEDLQEIMEGTSFTNEKNGEELEQRNVAEIDHPWHQYMEWDKCYDGTCRVHYPQKDKNQQFPKSQIPVYYSWLEMKEIVRRRRSTGQLQSKN